LCAPEWPISYAKIHAKGKLDAKNHPVLMVRRQSRRGDEVLCFYFQKFKDCGANRFQLDGQEFLVLNGGPQFTFTPAVSFFVNCESKQEVVEGG
jgi:hypothetical protein